MSRGLVDTVAFVNVFEGVAPDLSVDGDEVIDIAACEVFTQRVAVQAGSSITIYLSACDREAEYDPDDVQPLWLEARCCPRQAVRETWSRSFNPRAGDLPRPICIFLCRPVHPVKPQVYG